MEEYFNKLLNEIITEFIAKNIDIFTTISNTILDIKKTGEFVESSNFDITKLNDRIIIEIEVKGFLEGKFYVALTKEQVARFSDFMMMGDGKAEYQEEFKEAIGELYNQVMGAFISDINPKYTVNMELVGINVLDKLEELTADTFILELEIEMEGFEKTLFYLIIPKETIDSAVQTVEQQIDATENNTEIQSDESSISEAKLDSLDEEQSNNSKNSKLNLENLKLLLDIELDLSVQLGTTELTIEELLNLKRGSVIELDKLSGEPVDILVNGKVVATGEIVVIDDNFAIRLNNLVSLQERLLSLK